MSTRLMNAMRDAMESRHGTVESLQEEIAALESATTELNDALEVYQTLTAVQEQLEGDTALSPAIESHLDAYAAEEGLILSQESVFEKAKVVGKAIWKHIKELWAKVKAFLSGLLKKAAASFQSFAAKFRAARLRLESKHQQTTESLGLESSDSAIVRLNLMPSERAAFVSHAHYPMLISDDFFKLMDGFARAFNDFLAASDPKAATIRAIGVVRAVSAGLFAYKADALPELYVDNDVDPKAPHVRMEYYADGVSRDTGYTDDPRASAQLQSLANHYKFVVESGTEESEQTYSFGYRDLVSTIVAWEDGMQRIHSDIDRMCQRIKHFQETVDRGINVEPSGTDRELFFDVMRGVDTPQSNPVSKGPFILAFVNLAAKIDRLTNQVVHANRLGCEMALDVARRADEQVHG